MRYEQEGSRNIAQKGTAADEAQQVHPAHYNSDATDGDAHIAACGEY